MISDRLAKLESTLQEQGDKLPENTRRELQELLAGLRSEVTALLATHGENAQHIAGSAEAAVKATVQRDEHPDQAAEAVRGLTASVREFEATHPRLVEIVDQLALTLSNLGI